MIISALLTAFMLASMAVGVVMRRRSPAVALALMLASLAGIWFAWMPQQLTAVANALGVGRGTDLALYLWVSISFLALAGLALQLRHLQGQLTILVREIAILQAREQAPLHSAKAYLFSTARNAAFDYFRRRKIIAIDGIAEIDLLPVFDDRPGVAEAVCHDQELQLLAEAIQALPERCRRVLTLRKLHGLSHREIAQQLGIAENTVNAQIAIGVLRLRDYLRARGVTQSSSP